MPDEPNKRMDEKLRSYAAERRKAPDFTLHPATRQMLQGEVARTFGANSARRPWSQRMRAFWPQIAFAGGLCLVFGIAVLSLRQSSEVQESAPRLDEGITIRENDKVLEDQSLPKLEAQEQSQSPSAGLAVEENMPQLKQPEKVLDARSSTEGSEAIPRERKVPESSPITRGSTVELNKDQGESRLQKRVQQTAPPQSETETLLQKKEGPSAPRLRPAEAPLERAALEPLRDAPAEPSATRAFSAATVPAGQRLSSSSALTNLGAARRLNFVQVPNAADTKLAVAVQTLAPILKNFQVEQTGTNVRFYDEDGSLYLGALEATTVGEDVVQDAALPAEKPVLANSAAYFFSVKGTNETLRTDVVLTGRYFTQTNLQPSSLDSFAIAQEAKSKEPAQPRHLIIGNATLGRTNQVPVRAISNQP